jgi:GT2 family glycosyltransferase
MIGACRKDGIEYQEKKYADWLPGMGTVTHISVYDELGFIDDQNFPQYHGDSDFTCRAKENGYQIVVYPELKIFNDSKNTGLKHDESLRKLIQSLVSIKSNYNIKKDFLFYRLHARSMIAYKVLFLKYSKYIGGFFKWKILGFFGIHRG